MSEATNNRTETEIRAAQHPAHQHTNIQLSTENSMSSTAQELASKIGALRLADNYSASIGGEKLPLRPSFGKFNKHRFSRIHPGEEYKFRCLLVEDKDNGETYIATPAMQSYLGTNAVAKILRLSVDSTGAPKIIAEPILDGQGTPNSWHASMVKGIDLAETTWVRMEAARNASQYTIIRSRDDLGDPEWPTQSMEELVQEVFQNKIISDPDHPFARQLEGRR
jgi:hypothetical protein